jgi:hypothetical protein
MRDSPGFGFDNRECDPCILWPAFYRPRHDQEATIRAPDQRPLKTGVKPLAREMPDQFAAAGVQDFARH